MEIEINQILYVLAFVNFIWDIANLNPDPSLNWTKLTLFSFYAAACLSHVNSKSTK